MRAVVVIVHKMAAYLESGFRYFVTYLLSVVIVHLNFLVASFTSSRFGVGMIFQLPKLSIPSSPWCLSDEFTTDQLEITEINAPLPA